MPMAGEQDSGVDEARGQARTPLVEIDPVPVAARFERVDGGGRWHEAQWRLAAVEPADASSPLALRLHRDEAQGYWLNAGSAEPSIFVLWRLEDDRPIAKQVTLSYDEAGRWLDAGESVDRVPMPAEMLAWLSEYVSLHYRPEAPRKRRGTKPSFMSRDEFDSMTRRERGDPGAGGGSGRGDGR
jgi:hypothetical protein